MSHYYEFHDKLTFSKGIVAATCKETIRQMLPGCIEVRHTTTEMDKTGVDYVCVLRRGAEIYIDHKAREPGCRKWWDRDNAGEIDIALEVWSVKPEKNRPGKVGWTLDEAKLTHYTLHTFDPSDSLEAYLFPFQLLRKCYRKNYDHWNAVYKHGHQDSGAWKSECVFVPVHVILTELRKAMRLTDVAVIFDPGSNQLSLDFD